MFRWMEYPTPMSSSISIANRLGYWNSPFKVHVTRTSEAPPQTNKHVG